MSEPSLNTVRRYHDGTKHHFHRFAQSLGVLDWASQPRPFRSYDGAPLVSLYPRPDGPRMTDAPPEVRDDRLSAAPRGPGAPITAIALGDVLRHALGLSAWKVFRGSRWSLRVNPSSGNLHPTEAFVITGPLADLGITSNVFHYAPDRHVLERRCAFAAEGWRHAGIGDPSEACFIALTSIHWRESWKYGERAFRYCQHDLGHAIAALRLSAALWGWRAAILPAWPHRAVAALTGIDRDDDYFEAEREEPACVLLITRGASPPPSAAEPAAFLEAVRQGQWSGRASQLSEEHIEWSFIDQVARATEDPGRGSATRTPEVADANETHATDRQLSTDHTLDARALIVQRRSATAFDGASFVSLESFLCMLSRVLPGRGAPWDALWWSPRIHLAIFVHRVTGLEPGLYLLARSGSALEPLKAALDDAFLWEPASEALPLWRLDRVDERVRAKRLSCDQDIAADGFFSLAMIAAFDASLSEDGPAFYRQLFWESGVIGQVLYLEAEAHGARATGIGCFYDDAVHDRLGLGDHAFQSLYHFTVGIPVDDPRLATAPSYPWEVPQRM